MNTLVLDDYTINLIKTMALCKTEQMKAIKNKVMAKPFAPSSDKWLLFFDELHKNGLQKSDEYISNVMSIVIDTWVIWHVKTLDQNNSCEAIDYLHPAFELKRYVSSKFDRDWNARWNAAGKEIKWKGVSKKDGRMIALKTSPIWQALGRGVGGFNDSWGLPYPPFAIGSGMDWMQIEREECISLGLITEEYPDRPLSEAEKDIVEAVEKYGMPKIEY